MNEEQATIVRYRFTRAHEAVDEATVLQASGHFETCVNRLYYACFYAVNALLLSHGLNATTHSGLKTLFGQHFVKPGLITPALSGLYNTLFLYRQKSDYEDNYRIDPDIIGPWIPLTAEFITTIEILAAQHK